MEQTISTFYPPPPPKTVKKQQHLQKPPQKLNGFQRGSLV